jgi:hypothetical protein
MNITANNALSPYEVSKRRGTYKPQPDTAGQDNHDDSDDYDLNDDIPF